MTSVYYVCFYVISTTAAASAAAITVIIQIHLTRVVQKHDCFKELQLYLLELKEVT